MKFAHFYCGESWDEFLRSKFVVHIRKDIDAPAYRFNNPVDYWNSFYYNAFSINKEKYAVVRYETMLTNATYVLSNVASKFAVNISASEKCELPVNQLKRSGDVYYGEMLEDKAFNRELWYLEQRYLSEYTPDQIDFVSRNLDPEVALVAGYEVIAN